MSPSLRFKMHRIVRTLDRSGVAAIKKYLDNPKFQKALHALDELDVISLQTAWGGDIVDVFAGGHQMRYILERQEVWINRILGFAFGVFSSIIVQMAIKYL